MNTVSCTSCHVKQCRPQTRIPLTSKFHLQPTCTENMFAYNIPSSSCDYHLQSFFPRTVRDWNTRRSGRSSPPDVTSFFFAQQAQPLYLFTKTRQYELVFPLLAYIYAIYQPANINNTAEDNSHRIRNKPPIHALAIKFRKAGSNCSFYKTTNLKRIAITKN